jgi:hypothetical protein
VDVGGTGAWFEEYLRAFAACGRGESDDRGMLLHYYDGSEIGRLRAT